MKKPGPSKKAPKRKRSETTAQYEARTQLRQVQRLVAAGALPANTLFARGLRG